MEVSYAYLHSFQLRSVPAIESHKRDSLSLSNTNHAVTFVAERFHTLKALISTTRNARSLMYYRV